MSAHTESLKALAAKVESDGVIDAQEVRVLKDDLVRDRFVMRDEAEILFSLQESVKEETFAGDESFHDLFVEGVTSFLLNDPDAPGCLSVERFAWLQERISADHRYTGMESDLLKNLVMRAKALPPSFYDWARHLEIHLKDFGGDLDALEYEQRTSFMVELKALMAKCFPGTL